MKTCRSIILSAVSTSWLCFSRSSPVHRHRRAGGAAPARPTGYVGYSSYPSRPVQNTIQSVLGCCTTSCIRWSGRACIWRVLAKENEEELPTPLFIHLHARRAAHNTTIPGPDDTVMSALSLMFVILREEIIPPSATAFRHHQTLHTQIHILQNTH